MTVETITSRDNALLRRARLVRDGKIDDAIFVEGLRLCEEAVQSTLSIEAAMISDELAQKERPKLLLQTLDEKSIRTCLVSEALLSTISYTKTPQGVVILAARPPVDERTFKETQPVAPLIVILHSINNPVNVGAIVRTAEAAGVTGVITTKNSSDPFSAKALRGAMGSAFRLPIWTNAEYPDVIAWCRTRAIETASADVNGSVNYSDIDWMNSIALIMGPESEGLTEDEMKAADRVVRIPMKGKVESLNVGVAAAILLYEAARQRQ